MYIDLKKELNLRIQSAGNNVNGFGRPAEANGDKMYDAASENKILARCVARQDMWNLNCRDQQKRWLKLCAERSRR